MANYNADIRVGITGKTQLNALERQLGRINKDLNQINKNLKAQTLTVNTKGATRALDQLDRKINKLNRSINVNANINEKRSKSGGGNVFVSSGGIDAKQVALARALVTPAKALTDETQKQLDLEAEKLRQIDRLKKGQQDILDNQKAINKLEGQRAKLEKSTNNRSAAGMFGAGATRQQGLDKVNKELKNANDLLRVQNKVQESIVQDTVAASKAAGQYNAQLRKGVELQNKQAAAAARNKQLRKGVQAGGGLAAASATSSIPILGDAVTGGLAASFTQNATKATVVGGALAGAFVGIAAGAVAAAADVTTFNNALLKQQRALANTVSTSEELNAAFAAIEKASDDFLVPVGQATEQFTKLNAAARASGFTVSEVEEVYRGLAAANTALGGDSQKLQGILLATQQVFSKGKVQAEELRGQIGERLAGAFAKFAESAGLSTSELDKALEQGEVSLEDFVRFSKSLLEEYEDDAKKIADAPENAAQRLKLSMDDLRRAMGPIVTDIGNMFIEMANTVVAQLTRLFDFINKARTEAARTQAAADRANLQNVRADLKTAEENYQNNKNPITKFEFDRQSRAVALAMENVRGSAKVLNDITKLSLDATADPLKPRTQLTPDPSGSGSGSKSGPRDTTAELQAAIALQRTLLEIEQQRFGLTERELELRSFDQQRQTVEAELKKELADIQRDNITAESKALATTLAKLEAETDLQQIKNEQQRYEDAIAADIQQQITDLETQIAVEEAITDEMREQAILAARIAEIQNGPGEEGDKKRLIDAEKRLKEARDGNQGISGYMKQLQEELLDTKAMAVQMAQVIESEVGRALSSAITGVLDGTTTVQEAFASMFESIGKAFIDMATQMIAKLLVLKALQMITGILGGGGGGGGASFVPNSAYGDMSVAGPSFFGGGMIPGYSEGGILPSNGPAIVGENGPEFVYSEGGRTRVFSNQDSKAAMSMYSPGNESGPESNITMSFETTQFMDREWVDREQLEKAMAQTRMEATMAGARKGEAMTLSRLQNSRSSRQKLGL